jgi:Fe-S-cluster containining protein
MNPARPQTSTLECRPGCGACCIGPSISSPIPGMPHGKPAGVRCVQLTADNRCALFGRPDRPAVCLSLKAHEDMCGENREQALRWLGVLEIETRPDGKSLGLANCRPPSPFA